jgi:TolA-binding protein
MSDRPSGLESLRRVVSPPGMKRRVLRRIERRIGPRRRRARWRLALIFIPATAVAAGAVHRLVAPRAHDQPGEPHALEKPQGERAALSRARRSPLPPLPVVTVPAAQDPVIEREPPRRPARTRRRPAPPAPREPDSDDLSLQVAAYEQALALQQRAPRQALLRLRRMRQRWPRGPLAHEAALRIVETLLRIGEQEEARQAARRFLTDFPGSPRAPELRALVKKH